MTLKEAFQAVVGLAAVVFSALIALGRLALRKIRGWWRGFSVWWRRAIGTAFISFVLFIIVWNIYRIYDNNFGRCSYYPDYLSDNIVVHDFRDGKVRVYNTEARKYTTHRLNWVSTSADDDSLTVYALPHCRGFLNIYTGRIVIDAEQNNYTNAWVFSEGLAAVVVDGKVGFINAENEVVIPFKFPLPEYREWREYAFLFHDGYCQMVDENGKFGLIDKQGNWAIEPRFDRVWAPQEMGYRTVTANGFYGVVDAQMNIIYEPEYEFAENITAKGGFTLIKDGRMWQEDYEGNVVRSFLFESSDVLSYPVAMREDEDADWCNVYALSDYSWYCITGRYGIFNRITGEPLTPAIYSDVEMISPTLFQVSPADMCGDYLIDIKGNVVEPK